MPNFCRRKRSYQRYPDQSDWLNGEICTKTVKKLSEKLRAKFSATTAGYSMVKIACLDDAFSEFFVLEASPVECQSLQQKDKEKKRKGEKKKSNSLKTEVNFLSKN